MKTVTVKDLVIGTGAPKIIVSLMAKDIASVKSKALAYREADFDILEWRVDHYADLSNVDSVMAAAKILRETMPEKPLLFTFRSAKEGGEQAAGERANMRSIKRLAALLLTTGDAGAVGLRRRADERAVQRVPHLKISRPTEFWKSVFAGRRTPARSEYNVDLTILAPETEEEYEVQNDYVRQAIESTADAIVFSAISYTGNAPAIDEAVAAGIRVVVIDCDVDSRTACPSGSGRRQLWRPGA